MSRLLTLALLAIAFLGSCKQPAETKTSEEPIISSTYYIIRHAEKDRSDPENKDPMLTEEGLARAERWKAYFDTIALDAVYSTAYNRTISTAKPTAISKDLSVQTYEIQYVLSDAFRKETMGKKVLVVGHSNTTPPLANSLVGSEQFPNMKDTDNSSLYVVRITDSTANVEVRTVD